MTHLLVSLVSVLALLIALSTHEFCHALAAYLQGDETAKRAGRMTLNPLSHLDPIGTVLVPLLGFFSGLPLIAWAKPVPMNPYNLRNQKWGAVIVALAGPAANFISALICLGLLKLAVDVIGLPFLNLAVIFLTLMVVVNVVLGIFNFIPVPPLDGSKLLAALLDSPKHRHILFFLETRGPMILFMIVMLDFISPYPFLGSIFGGALRIVFSLAGLEHVLAAI